MSKADFNFDRTQFMAVVDYTSQTGQASSARVTFNASNVTRIYFRKCKERKFMFFEYHIIHPFGKSLAKYVEKCTYYFYYSIKTRILQDGCRG